MAYLTMMSQIGTIDPTWNDMSKYVVHFTKEGDGQTAYAQSLSMLFARRIEARNAFGAGRHLPPAKKSVCFSEVPLHLLKRIADERGEYGIGFRKEFLVAEGGGPILYAYKDTAQAKAIQSMVHASQDAPNDPVWNLAPFVDIPGVYGKSKYLFEFEREWRKVGDLDFDASDPAFLIIPEAQHEAARGFFDQAEEDHIGPNYECPFIDAYWSEEKISGVLSD